MGCFLGCFGGAKDRKHRRPTNNRSPPSHRIHESYNALQQSPPPKRLALEVALEVADVSVPELREKPEQESSSGSRKKVTFDLNVETYEEAPVDEVAKCSSEDEEEKEVVKEEGEPQDGGSAYPSNHRYQNCASSDEEDIVDGEEEEYEDCDFDEEDDGVGVEGNEEESYDSYFSLPMVKERQGLQEVNSPKPIKAPSPDREPILLAKGSARDRSQYVHSVLNPVENLSQWKEVKDRAAPLKNSMKENVNSELETKMAFCPQPTFSIKKPQQPINSNPSPNYSTKQEISVDASLSNWLVSSEHSPTEGPKGSNSLQSNSSFSREDRPILGALTVEDLKQSSVTSSPRRSPSRSPDEIPILGTVGSYWSSTNMDDDSASSRRSGLDTKGIPNTTSKYREDKRVKWHSTPFDVRLERALNEGAAAEGSPRFPPAAVF